MPTINNSTKKTLSGIFDKAIFNIPTYQRAYSWEESNWRELWDDIKNNVLDRDKEHFLGAMIYYHGNSEGSKYSHYEIIDGQQRISTITILMRVLYEKLKENNTEVYLRFAEELYEKYIGDTQNETFFLNLSKKDETFFRDYIQKKNPNRKQGKLISNKNIRKCYEFFHSKIEEISRSSSGGKIEEFCWDLKKKLETNLVFVAIDVNTDVDAYMIFESINSKRQGLTTSDLLKNYIFSLADQYEKIKPESRKLRITEDAWDRMEQSLDKIEINQYIRHFWISYYGKVFEKELYQQIKLKFNTNTEPALAFFDNAVTESETYSGIINANIPDFPQDGIRALEQLKQLRNRQYYPLILSAIHGGWDPGEIAVLLKQVASVAVRRSLTGRNPNELEAFFTESATKLRTKTVTPRELVTKLSSEYWIKDEEILGEIKSANFEDQEYLAKFLLKEYEISKNPANEKTLGKLSLEHVLPRNPDDLSDWDIADEEKHSELVWNIGNLALIGQKYNLKMSNKAFEKKKPWLKKTEVKTTASLAGCSSWSEGEIVNRNNEIGRFVINWWPKQ